MIRASDQQKRNADIVALAAAGGLSYRSIGLRCNVSRARVGQIVLAALGRRFGLKAPPLDAEERAQIADMAGRGLCMAEIGRTLGRSPHTVRRALLAAGINPGNQMDVFGKAARARAIDLVRQGYTFSEAAHATGMTRNAVAGACRRAGLSVSGKAERSERNSRGVRRHLAKLSAEARRAWGLRMRDLRLARRGSRPCACGAVIEGKAERCNACALDRKRAQARAHARASHSKRKAGPCP